MRHQKCRWTQSHSKFYFTSANGKVELATEKTCLVLRGLTHARTTSRDNGCNLSYCKSI